MRKQHVWSRPEVAAEYDRRRFSSVLQRHKHRHDGNRVLALLERSGVVRGARILDLPCGTGRMTPILAGAGYGVVGVDLSLAMMQAGGEEGATYRLQASAFHLPFVPGSFAAALSLRFLFHLDDRAERVWVMRELARVTLGPILLQVRYRHTGKHAGRWLRNRLGVGAASYRPSQGRRELEAELEEAGLELERLVPMSQLFSDKAILVARAPLKVGLRKGDEVGAQVTGRPRLTFLPT